MKLIKICFLLMVLCVSISQKIMATTYYWVGGSGNWNTNKWALSSNGPTVAATPNSLDDVIFDDFSGLATSNGVFTITVASNSCRNMTFSLTATTATTVTINFTGTRFDIFGNLTVSLPSAVSLQFSNNGLRFQIASNGNTNTITNNIGNRLTFTNTLFFDNTSSGTFNFNGLFYNTLVTGSAITVSENTTLGAPTVTLNFDTKAIINNMNCSNSLVNFNAGLGRITINGNTGLGVQTTSTVNINADSEIGAGNFSGIVNMPNVNVNMVSLTGGGSPISYLDITNSTITLQGAGNSPGTWLYTKTTDIITTNSKLLFPNGANIYAYNGNYNLIVINETLSERYTVPSALKNGIEVDSLIIDAEMSFGGNIKINSLIQIAPGHNCIGEFATIITASSTVTTSIAGTCQQPNAFREVSFNFQTGSHTAPYLIADYLILNNSTVTSTVAANAGGNSIKVVNTNTSNWVIGTPSSRTLYWIGAIPSLISDSTSYGNWWDMNNWSSNPLASPSNPIGGPTCPPTYQDSVVFPNNSYVNCNLAKQYCKSMLWQGAGKLYSGTSYLIEIWGSLEFSTVMSNRFNGTFWFKTYETYPTLTTRAKPFPGGIIFAATSLTGTVSTGEWLLKDKLYAPNIDRNTPTNNFPYNNTFNGGAFTIALIKGHLKTGIDANTSLPGIQIDPILSQSQDIDCLGFLMEGGSILSLFNSNVNVSGTNLVSYMQYNRYPAPFTINDFNRLGFNVIPVASCTINAGTSNIILTANNITVGQNYSTYQYGSTYTGPGAYLGKGHKFYDITFSGANATGVVELFQDTIRRLNFSGGGFVRQYANWTGYTSSTLNQSGLISRVNFNNANKLAYFECILDYPNTHTNYQITVDSLYFMGNGNFNNIDVKIRSLLNLSSGYAYELKNGQNVELVSPTSGSNYPYPYQQLASQTNTFNFVNGGVLNSIGTCTSNISISGGNFIGNSNINNVRYNLISNNTFSGTGYNYLNSVLSGTTTGWSGVPDAGRKLHWKDNSGIANNIKQWNNPSSWEEINADGTLKYAAPQCPPTRIDTVIFDASSFSASNQVVQVNMGTSIAECYSMYWGNTAFSISSSSLAPKFDAPTTQQLSVFGNLQFNPGMTQNFLGPITFRGSYDYNFGGSGLYNFIESAGKSMYPPIIFNADDDTKRWELIDAIKTVTVPASSNYLISLGHFNLWRGVFDSKGKNMDIGNFNSVSNTYRRLILNNSKVSIRFTRISSINGYNAPDWNVAGISSASLFHINAGTSEIIANSASYFCGGGHKYNNITIPPTSVSNAFYIAGAGNSYNKDTFNVVNNQKNSAALVLGLTIGSPAYTPDSLIIHKIISNGDFTCYSDGNKIDSLTMYGNGNLYTNNTFSNLLQFTPSKTYIFASNKVQWIKNSGKFYPIGSSGNHIQFYSSVTGIPAYVRKDSGYVCADYIYMKDIWGIGNGNNLGSCISGTVSGINTNCTPTPTNNTWIKSTCDTITDYLSSCGPFQTGNTSTYLRGRADFNGGPSADYQSNIYGWAKNPYPALPKYTLTSITPSVICYGDSILATYNGIGAFPLTLTYTSSIGSSVTTYTNSSQLTSYNSLNSNFTYTTYLKPTTSGTLSAVYISVERCFNSDTMGTGSFHYKVNPKPEFEKYSKHVACKGTASGVAAVKELMAGTPNYNYNWGGALPNNDSINVVAGTYTCYITDAVGCKDTVSLSVIEPTVALALSVSTGTTNCNQSIGALTTTVAGGWSNSYNYLWQSTSSSTLSTIAFATNLSAGNYTVIVSDTGNCVIAKYTSVISPAAPSVSSIITNSINCFGESTGGFSVTITPGGSPTYSINWEAPLTYTGSILSFSTSSITNLSVGNYTVTVIDDNNCFTNQVYSINQPASAITSTLATLSNVNCFAASTGYASINTSGGTGAITYSWIPSGGNNASSSGLTAGDYTISISDANNCNISQTLTIIQPSTALTFASATHTNVLCSGQNNGAAEVSVIGGTNGYTYAWQPSSVSSNTSSANNLAVGNYTLMVTDLNGCSITQTFIITEPNALTTTLSNTTQAGCGLSNGQATINVNGGNPSYSYSWTNAANVTYTTSSSSTNSLSAGINQLTITDANGCTTYTNISITNPNAPIITTTVTHVSCFANSNGSINTSVSGGTPVYSYTWTNGSISQTNANLSGVSAGIYTLTVLDASNCIATYTATVSQPNSALNLSISNINNVNCYEDATGSASVTASGGTPNYTYTWQPGNINTNNITNKNVGIYTVTAMDANGCIENMIVPITSSATSPLLIKVTEVKKSICEQSNGAIKVDISGGTPNYNYLWNTGNSNTETLSNLSVGNYSLIVVDNNGCKDTMYFKLGCKIDLLIPQIFSPNGDGINEKFEIKAISEYPNNNLQIFNRWGNLVYSKSKYNNEWDGRLNVKDATGSALLPAGTYFVVLDFGDGETVTYHGYVQLEY